MYPRFNLKGLRNRRGMVWFGMEGSKVLVIFDDGNREGKVSSKEGIITSITNFSVTLDKKHIIPKSRIYRIEILSYKE